MSCVVLHKDVWDNIVNYAFAGDDTIFTEVRNADFKELVVDFAALGDELVVYDKKEESQHLYGLYLKATTGNEPVGLKRPVELAAIALGSLDFRMKEDKLRNKESLLGKVYDLCSDRPPE